MAISSTTWRRGRPKTGGRRAGTPNRVTRAHREIIEKMTVDRSDPLSFFLSVLRNPDTPFEEARAAAKEALPYCSPKLASIEARAGGQSHEDRLEMLQRLLEDE
jgi:hypothetical protein